MSDVLVFVVATNRRGNVEIGKVGSASVGFRGDISAVNVKLSSKLDRITGLVGNLKYLRCRMLLKQPLAELGVLLPVVASILQTNTVRLS